MAVDIQEILRGCIEKKPRAQELLYSTYFGKFFPICLRYVGNAEEAEEVLNDAFVKIFNSLDTFRNEGSAEGWMRRIIVNKCLDFLRKVEKSRKTFKTVDEFFATAQILPETQEEVELFYLSWLLDQLPVLQKRVFNLFVMDGYAHAEIAKMLDISETNSKACLHKARKNLQARYKKYNLNESA